MGYCSTGADEEGWLVDVDEMEGKGETYDSTERTSFVFVART